MKHTKHFNHAHRINNYAMNQRMTQEEILQLVQKAGDKVAEAMNIITDVGEQFGINVHFNQIHFDQTRRSNQPANKMASWTRRSNQSANGASDNKNNNENEDNESSEVLARLSTGTSDMLSDEEMTNIVTIPDLAEMISDETDIKEECALEVLEAAFDLIEEYGLILDLGSWDSNDSDNDMLTMMLMMVAVIAVIAITAKHRSC